MIGDYIKLIYGCGLDCFHTHTHTLEKKMTDGGSINCHRYTTASAAQVNQLTASDGCGDCPEP